MSRYFRNKTRKKPPENNYVNYHRKTLRKRRDRYREKLKTRNNILKRTGSILLRGLGKILFP